MFGSRSKNEKAAPPQDAARADLTKETRDPQAPKGRPTPKRSQAQTQRRTLAAPTNRKEAAKRVREERRLAMAKQREALAGGDERFLPVRDKGPVRKFVRDYVDSRWHAAEFFLPVAVIILVLGMLGQRSSAMLTLTSVLWGVLIIAMGGQSLLTARLLKKALREKFPKENLRGTTFYGLMRTMQLRRMRLPKPQVKRGEKP
ncbi:hypothetical protein SRB5_55100 [Streptomyces sp. RB5]|uniref:DUF3043 domain-containing protein n=1 Tax=Streptomyces smaragdinus TaxID=2585196 RepID=A0A7K0CPK0_9ACTN|nr:DUF3043 domain-containing protein [Streptomyces smaragdinus]MQY15331.1 hypothetical protein [Streptomyces smaragdinus]